VSEATILDAMIAKAQSRIEELKRRIGIQEEILAELQSQRSELGGATRDVEVPPPAESNGQPARSFTRDDLADAIVEILKKNGGPMQLSDITREVRKRGFGKGPGQSLMKLVYGTISKRVARFEKISRGTYQIRT
jgi:hypothetical protein